MNNLSLRIVLLILITLSACRKPDEYPDEPVITFKDMYTQQNAQGYDANIYVLLSFTDGDGDIGYKDVGSNDAIFDDPTSQYYNNFQVRTYRFINNAWVQDTTDLSARMLDITPEVANKALKGEILRELPVPPNLVNDTFRFDIFIYDRALHQSNTITTPDIILNTQ